MPTIERNSFIETLIMMDCSSAASCFNNSIRVESKKGIMDDDDKRNSRVSDLSDVSSVVSSDDSDNLFEEEVNSNESSSSSSSSGSSPTAAAAAATGPLQDMSSLLQELPFKRGLSKHYNGKSQSFTSLSNVRCLEDLAKPENPYNKKLKSCRSYGGGLMLQEIGRHGSLLKKTASRGSGSSSHCSSSLCVRRNQSTGGFLGNNRRTPPVPPPSHRSSTSGSSSRSNFATQTPLFALGV